MKCCLEIYELSFKHGGIESKLHSRNQKNDDILERARRF